MECVAFHAWSSPRSNATVKKGVVDDHRFGCVLLPDEPNHIAEGFDRSIEFVEPPEGGGGSWYNKIEGRRMLRLWGLSLGMTL